MEHALSQFSGLPMTKKSRATFIEMAVNEVTSGTRNPLELEIALKNVEEIVKAIRANEDWKRAAIDEAHNYPEKSFEFHGVKITKTNHTAYDFNDCGDSALNVMEESLSNLKEDIKDRKDFLKTIKPGMEVADGGSGELLNPPAKMTTEGLTLSFPNE